MARAYSPRSNDVLPRRSSSAAGNGAALGAAWKSRRTTIPTHTLLIQPHGYLPRFSRGDVDTLSEGFFSKKDHDVQTLAHLVADVKGNRNSFARTNRGAPGVRPSITHLAHQNAGLGAHRLQVDRQAGWLGVEVDVEVIPGRPVHLRPHGHFLSVTASVVAELQDVRPVPRNRDAVL